MTYRDTSLGVNAMQLAPSLHRLGDSSLVNSYLVADERGVTIIDAGLPGYWKDLPRELAAMGRTVDDVRGVVLTHGDTDHVGFSERLRAERGVPVFVHSADAARARMEIKKSNTGWGPMKIGPLLGFLWYAGRRGGLRVPALSEVRTFEDGATLDLPGSPRIIHIPGHTPGSVAVHVPAVDAVFVGDALTTRSVLTGRVGPQPAPFTLDPAGARESLARVSATGARWVLPGHGDPWDRGAAEAVRLVREA
jgi:glyoxylase-like metal-dependent hydrolase (beta-lactamase superfamily II)